MIAKQLGVVPIGYGLHVLVGFVPGIRRGPLGDGLASFGRQFAVLGLGYVLFRRLVGRLVELLEGVAFLLAELANFLLVAHLGRRIDAGGILFLQLRALPIQRGFGHPRQVFEGLGLLCLEVL